METPDLFHYTNVVRAVKKCELSVYSGDSLGAVMVHF